jgi:transcription elongation factor GreA
MKDTPEYLTKEKLNELKGELNVLKTVKRREIAEKLDFAKSLGDLSENAEYHQARDQQADIEDRIEQLEDIIKRAKIITGHHKGVVEIGSKVKVKKNNDSEIIFFIVGPEEADALAGKISFKSPIGEALLGHKVGDKVPVVTPRGECQYKILAID